MNYKHLSGSEKRKQKQLRERERERQKGAILSFVQTVQPNSIDPNPLPSTSRDERSIESSSPIVAENSSSILTNDNEASITDEPSSSFACHEKLSLSPSIETFASDISEWPKQASADFQEYFANNPPNQCMDRISECKKQFDNKKIRKLPESAFFKIKPNGEKVLREWLVFSPSTGSVFCYVCKLFSTKMVNLSVGGYSDWKNVGLALKTHETSPEHVTSIGILVKRRSIEGRIDTKMEICYQKEKEYWRNILQRVVATIKFLSKNGLSFFGSTTKLFTKGNGNFLSCLEYLSEFDPFLASHLQKYGNPGSGKVSYISPSICSEFITILSHEVQKSIVEEVQTAKYFSIITDSTPDISHTDQLTIILRYVLPSGYVVERFLGFVPIFSHTAKDLSLIILKTLKDLNIDIANCRGQSYDNAANMSGRYNGLQAKIKNITESAHFVPCSSHSLNLVGNSAAESCLEAAKFFDIVQCVYNFFSVSTYRWSVLQTNLESSKNKLSQVKKICDTRWSARADAVKSISLGLTEIKMALTQLNEDLNQKRSTRVEANDLCNKLKSFEFALMLVIWKKILDRLNATSKSLQEIDNNLIVTCTLYDSLIQFVRKLREQYDEIEEEAKTLQPENSFYKNSTSRNKKRKKFEDEGPS